VSAGTFLYATRMYHRSVRYELTVMFRAPDSPPGCLWWQEFSFSWVAGAWRVHPGAVARC
jgi:hypothetical protein